MYLGRNATYQSVMNRRIRCPSISSLIVSGSSDEKISPIAEPWHSCISIRAYCSIGCVFRFCKPSLHPDIHRAV
jgi:hypothetical protein